MTTRTVFVCATVKNRGQNLKRLLESIGQMQEAAEIRFVVADYASTDTDLREVLRGHKFPTKLVTLRGGHFNRSQGLNLAQVYSGAAAASLLFFVDVDMLMPAEFVSLMHEKVVQGTCWFPICYSLHRGKPAVIHKNTKKPKLGNGWWRDTGKGMCGFVQKDFLAIRRWNEITGVTYGKEDGEMTVKAKRHGLRIVRDRCPGLFHVWHPVGNYKTKHHRKDGVQRGKRNPVPVKPSVEIWTSGD